MAVEVGALRALLSLDTAAFERGAKRATAHMGKIQARLQKVGKRFDKFGKSLTKRVSLPIVAAAGLAVKSSLSMIDSQAKMAQSLGTTVESMQVLGRAADLAGVSTGELEQVSLQLTKRLSQAAAGGGPAAAALDSLGLSAENLSQMPLDQRIAVINQAIEDTVPAAQRAATAAKLFGDRAGLVASRLDPETIKAATDQIKRFGVGVSDVDADKIESANDAISGLGLVTKGLANQITVALAPTLQAIAERIADVGEWFSKLSPEVKRFAGIATAVAAALGPALIAIGFLATGLAAVSAPVVLVVGGLAAVAAAGAYLEQRWGAITAIVEAVKLAWVQFSEGIQGYIAPALDGLGAAWDNIKGAFGNLVEAFGSLFAMFGGTEFTSSKSGLLDLNTALGNLAGIAFQSIAAGLELFARGLETVTGVIAAAFEGNWSGVLDQLEEFGDWFATTKAGKMASAIGEKIGGAISDMASKLSKKFPAATRAAEEFVVNFAKGFPVVIREISDLAKDIAAELVQMAANLFEAALDIGAQIVAGIKQGIKNKWNELTAYLSSLTDLLPEWIRKKWEIHSPSRVFAEIGQFAIDGLIVGFDERSREAIDRAGQLASDVGQGVNDTLAPLISGASQHFGDFVARGFKDFSGFIDGIKDTFKQALSQMIATAAKNKIMFSMGLSGNTALGAAGGGGAVPGGGGVLSGGMGGLAALGSAAYGGFVNALGSLFGAGGGLGAMFGSIGAQAAAATTGSLTAISGAVGALAVPVLIVTAAFSFFKKKIKVLDTGLRVAANSTNTLVKEFEKIQIKRFWGLSKKTREEESEADDEVAGPISKAIAEIRESVLAAGARIGLTAEKFSSWASDIKVSLKGLDEAAASAKIQEMFQTIAEDLSLAGLGAFEVIREGETAQATLNALAVAIEVVNGTFKNLGFRLKDVSVMGADAARRFTDLFGGVEGFAKSADAYYQAVYSEAERMGNVGRELSRMFGEMGYADLPQTREQIREIVDGLMEVGTTDVAARIIQITPALAEYIDYLKEQAQVTSQAAIAAAEMAARLSEVTAEISTRFAAGMDFIVQNFYSTSQQLEHYSERAKLAFLAAGIEMPQTAAAFQSAAQKAAADVQRILDMVAQGKASLAELERAKAQQLAIIELADEAKRVYDLQDKANQERLAAAERAAKAAAERAAALDRKRQSASVRVTKSVGSTVSALDTLRDKLTSTIADISKTATKVNDVSRQASARIVALAITTGKAWEATFMPALDSLKDIDASRFQSRLEFDRARAQTGHLLARAHASIRRVEDDPMTAREMREYHNEAVRKYADIEDVLTRLLSVNKQGLA
ncbi:hypothetical protein HKX54_02380 [Sulfitobacter sp. M57]|uniref:phage tail protein n=1 Tax=unclassified Sulfitobacter TaxID=196795 RepID=UPI0023E0BB4B|nr:MULTISPECIES: hypothetical protein [unclassified Sulfitobacter]MDF3413290.1 hypothetical protein [Sulfitobacter sp. KE5]MDF3421430.1 hypothetical protein [Sulfitobacter sp. KE43]MDF3431837.1 hypothetical protein [Sulfitobacter sp. KE42]MDF3457477.1 hypothetical protein [Sulfitobacter sp. S74]MDF3461379.1 hypothetical protein [Sulfitobacter sp. Ks18]